MKVQRWIRFEKAVALSLALGAVGISACTERPVPVESGRPGVEAPMSELDRELASPGEDPTLGQVGVKAETEIDDVTLPGEGPNPTEEVVENAIDARRDTGRDTGGGAQGDRNESESATTTR